ncbi:hypothetical protein M885DRAFT_549381, partial [Pelagophyceae sp. CCMP2097]
MGLCHAATASVLSSKQSIFSTRFASRSWISVAELMLKAVGGNGALSNMPGFKEPLKGVGRPGRRRPAAVQVGFLGQRVPAPFGQFGHRVSGQSGGCGLGGVEWGRHRHIGAEPRPRGRSDGVARVPAEDPGHVRRPRILDYCRRGGRVARGRGRRARTGGFREGVRVPRRRGGGARLHRGRA